MEDELARGGQNLVGEPDSITRRRAVAGLRDLSGQVGVEPGAGVELPFPVDCDAPR